MKKIPLCLKKAAPTLQKQNRNALRGGSYSLGITAIVLAIVIVVNVLAQALPSSWTKYDISSSKLYSITGNTKVVVNALEKDVTIYWIVQNGEEDKIIENLLNKYDSLSEHIEIFKKNPDVYPTFAAQYTSENVLNNSLIVECGERSRFISYNDIYLVQADMMSYSYSASFDGEGAITSAIDYVVNEEQPQLFALTGHGEKELSNDFSEQIAKENIELSNFSLLNVDAIPEETDCLLIYAPASDISQAEKELLAEYVADGGKLLVLAGPTENGTLTNLYELLADYGVYAEDGIVVENDRGYYAFQMPYVLLPDIVEDALTNPLIEENYYTIVPIAQGLSVDYAAGADVRQLLTTSTTSYSKKDGYSLSSYEKDESDIDGPFAVAVAVENDNGGQIVWFSSSYFLEDIYNAYSSGANLDLTMNALAEMIGENEAVAIRSKSLNYNYLTISDSTATLLKTMMIGAVPLGYLLIGIAVVLKRRRQNESL